MATHSEKRWPHLRIEWAKQKIQEWTAQLEHELSLLKRKKLQDDITTLKHVLADWEDDLDA